MTEFEKGHWNLDELEIQEWIDTKQKGFMRFDVVTLKEKVLEDINRIEELYRNDHPESDREFEEEETAKAVLKEVRNRINDLFGFEVD